jgi:hypothetical protein
MDTRESPTAVLICHEGDRLDREGLASWLANTMRLAGLILIRDDRGRLWRASRREIRRVGILRFLDVVAFRVYARLALAGKDAAGSNANPRATSTRYPADLRNVPQTSSRVRTEDAQAFLAALKPDPPRAGKVILKPEMLNVPAGHVRAASRHRPDINATGVSWALPIVI